MIEKINKMQQMFIFNNISTCFGHHYAHLQENKTYYCMWCAALVLLDVVGSIQQNQRSTPRAVTHMSCSPEDGHNDARNMLRYC